MAVREIKGGGTSVLEGGNVRQYRITGFLIGAGLCLRAEVNWPVFWPDWTVCFGMCSTVYFSD